MKNRTLSLILTAVCALSLTACTGNEGDATTETVTEATEETVVEEEPVTEEVTEESEPAEEPEEEVAEELVLPEEIIKEITDNLWYTQVDWEVDPRWDEHEGEACVQVCDIFVYEGETYEDVLEEYRNSEFIKKEIERGKIKFYNGSYHVADDDDEKYFPDLNSVPEKFDEYGYLGGFYLPEFGAGVIDSESYEIGFGFAIRQSISQGQKEDGYGTVDLHYNESRNVVPNSGFAPSIITGGPDCPAYGVDYANSVVRISKDDVLTPLDMDFYLSEVNDRYKIEHGMR